MDMSEEYCSKMTDRQAILYYATPNNTAFSPSCMQSPNMLGT